MSLPNPLTRTADKAGVIGAIVTAMGCAACFPALASLGAAIGLGFLSQYEGVFIHYLLPLFAVIALLANVFGGLRHRQWLRMVLGMVGPVLVLAAALVAHGVVALSRSGVDGRGIDLGSGIPAGKRSQRSKPRPYLLLSGGHGLRLTGSWIEPANSQRLGPSASHREMKHEGVADGQENRPYHGSDRHGHCASVDRRGALLLLIGAIPRS